MGAMTANRQRMPAFTHHALLDFVNDALNMMTIRRVWKRLGPVASLWFATCQGMVPPRAKAQHRTLEASDGAER